MIERFILLEFPRSCDIPAGFVLGTDVSSAAG